MGWEEQADPLLASGRAGDHGLFGAGPARWPHLVRFWRMRGTMLEGGPALARNGCFSSSAAVARWAGSRTSRRSRKPFRDGDTCGVGRGQGERAHSTALIFLLSGAPTALGGAGRSPVLQSARRAHLLFSQSGKELAALPHGMSPPPGRP